MKSVSKQDRHGARTPADIERKYGQRLVSLEKAVQELERKVALLEKGVSE